MENNNLEEKLQTLRKEWLEKPHLRNVIEARAKLIKWVQEKKEIEETEKNVLDIFI